MKPEVLPDLDRAVRAVATASAPAEIFKVLHQASAKAAPRAALFLVRKGQVLGWGSVGYPPALAQQQRAYAAPLPAAWSPENGVGSAPDFGQARAAESIALAVRVKGKPIALLIAERLAGEAPWYPLALDVLATVARLRLELDLAQRRLETVGGSAEPATVAPAVVTPSAPTSPAPRAAAGASPAAAAVSTATSLAPAATADPDPPELIAARRFARLVATDIRLYNEEAVVAGRRNGDLCTRLGEQLDRGKQTFLRRHGSLGPAGLGLLHEAYVQVLAAGDERLIPPTALD